MKKLILHTLFIVQFLTFTIKPIFAEAITCDGTRRNPCIIQETQNNSPELRNWRDTTMIYENYTGNRDGLKTLWISGSSAPSANGFKTIIHNVKQATNNRVKKIIDIDLRQETHAYLNNNSISLTAKSNRLNIDKTHEEIITFEQDWLNYLKELKYVFNVFTHTQFKAKSFDKGVNIPINSISSEKKLVEGLGMQYLRIMVTDNMKPDAIAVAKFVEFVNKLPTDVWLHFHCRAGKGRTTTFMAMYDMLQNAGVVSFDDIIKRQAAAPPYMDLSDLSKIYSQDHPERNKYAKERFEFLKEFYKFAQTNTVIPRRPVTPWIDHGDGVQRL